MNTSIEIISADGASKTTLFHREGFSAFSGLWSPAGDKIALSVGRYFRAAGLPPAQIGLIKPDGSTFRLIVDDDMNNGFPSWAPDGDRLVFKRGRQLVVTSLADGAVVPLTDASYYSNFPQWSPDSDRIMFTANRDGDFELYTTRPDGTRLRRLTDVPGHDATRPSVPTATGSFSAARARDSRMRWRCTTLCLSRTARSSRCALTARMYGS